MRLQAEVAPRAHEQEGEEIAHLAARLHKLVGELFNQLHHAHAVALADFLQHMPTEVF